MIIACSVLIQSQSVMDRQTNTDMGVAREKSCAVLNFACFDSLVCIVACSREKSRSLSLVPFLALAYKSSIHISNALFITNQSHGSYSRRVQPANTGWRTGQPGSLVSPHLL